MSGMKLEELPEIVSNLCNLQTLKLNRCLYLRRLPEGMGKLVNLRHLEIEETDGLECLPQRIDITNIKGKGNEYDEAELKNKEYLKIHKLDSAKPIDLEVHGISDDGQECGTAEAPELISFPKMKELEVSFMSWENWVMRRGNIILSCLVEDCSNLRMRSPKWSFRSIQDLQSPIDVLSNRKKDFEPENVSKVGMPSLVCFLNKVDDVDDQLVEMGPRMLSFYKFPEDDIPIICASALSTLQAMLAEKMHIHSASGYLVNTGWSGGSSGNSY
ncbi:hypothetical protein GIB67_041842 [Kingdonia uniflora]|uniref:Uncharacterized protein n=1 Tax=Kingdonia uniflora TaxID=39325 RepID=A0A7J7L5Y4_9MAGN|nr:hypothetical protein GIB67_041842 [Kingdonia uniflora]